MTTFGLVPKKSIEPLHDHSNRMLTLPRSDMPSFTLITVNPERRWRSKMCPGMVIKHPDPANLSDRMIQYLKDSRFKATREIMLDGHGFYAVRSVLFPDFQFLIGPSSP